MLATCKRCTLLLTLLFVLNQFYFSTSFRSVLAKLSKTPAYEGIEKKKGTRKKGRKRGS